MEARHDGEYKDTINTWGEIKKTVLVEYAAMSRQIYLDTEIH